MGVYHSLCVRVVCVVVDCMGDNLSVGEYSESMLVLGLSVNVGGVSVWCWLSLGWWCPKMVGGFGLGRQTGDGKKRLMKEHPC